MFRHSCFLQFTVLRLCLLYVYVFWVQVGTLIYYQKMFNFLGAIGFLVLLMSR